MYSATDRRIYQLPTGGNYDPLELRRKLTIATRGQLSQLIAVFNDSDSEYERATAEEALVTATRLSFGCKPLTEAGGVGDATVLEYLANFLEFL